MRKAEGKICPRNDTSNTSPSLQQLPPVLSFPSSHPPLLAAVPGSAVPGSSLGLSELPAAQGSGIWVDPLPLGNELAQLSTNKRKAPSWSKLSCAGASSTDLLPPCEHPWSWLRAKPWGAVAASHGQSQPQTILFQEGGAGPGPLCGAWGLRRLHHVPKSNRGTAALGSGGALCRQSWRRG